MSKGLTRKPSLGVNYDLGDFGAVVVYSGELEYPVAYLPDAAAVTAEHAYSLAARYKKAGKKVLTVNQTCRVLKMKVTKPNKQVPVK